MLKIYFVALEMLKRLPITAIERKDGDLARQLRRAATSVVLNIAEGSGCCGGTRRQRYCDALGSAREVQACIDSSIALGYITISGVEGLREITGSLVKLTR